MRFWPGVLLMLPLGVAVSAHARVAADPPVDMPASWLGYYARDLAACRADADVANFAIRRDGLQLHDGTVLARRIVWLRAGEDLRLSGILRRDDHAAPASYRLRMARDGRALTFWGVDSANDDNAKGVRYVRCLAI